MIDITQLRDNYREFVTIFNRRGSAISTDLFFNGDVNYFKELPAAENMNAETYKNVKEKNVKIKLT